MCISNNHECFCVQVFINEAEKMRTIMTHQRPWRDESIFIDHHSPVYCRLMYRDAFQYYSFLDEVAFQRLNESTADLTPQNLKGAREVIAGMIMHSLRSRNNGYIMLGALVWWMDGKGNYVTRRDNVSVFSYIKSPSGGLDFTLGKVGEWFRSHEKVLPNCKPGEDGQNLIPMKGSTKTGYNSGMVMLSQNKVLKVRAYWMCSKINILVGFRGTKTLNYSPNILYWEGIFFSINY